MTQHREDDTTKYPPLGRLLAGIDAPRNVRRIVYGLYILCTLLFAADFLYHKHTELGVEEVPGFYAVYGFVMCALLVITARGLRVILMRPEDYYAPRDVDSEPYPEDQMERARYDD